MNDNLGDDLPFPPAIPAATLVLFRERDSGPPELLVVERSTKMAFAGGATVFPGGRIDGDDHTVASCDSLVITTQSLALDEAAARVAAIRETLEESGIAIGFATQPPGDWIETARQRLHAGDMFSQILTQTGQALMLDQLIPFARWRPNFREARVFDTRFYIACAAPEAGEPIVDDTENIQSFWASAAHLLTAADAGALWVIYPTRRNLERLALFADFAAAAAQAITIPVEIICPIVEERDGERYLCIPADLGYPVTSEIMSAVARGFKI